jgi:flagellar M-ring protein FliF
VAGVAANVPGLGGGGGGRDSTQGSTRETETINYEISKVVRRKVGAAGAILQLDVAVLVDGQPGKGDEFVAWSPEELTRFEELAKRAVGYDEERGDKITLSSAPFLPDVAGPIDAGGFSIAPEWILIGGSLLRIAGLLLALVLFARLVANPIASSLAASGSASLPARAGDLEAQLAAGGDGTMALPEDTGASQFSGPGGEEAVKTLRVWLSER